MEVIKTKEKSRLKNSNAYSYFYSKNQNFMPRSVMCFVKNVSKQRVLDRIVLIFNKASLSRCFHH